MKPGKKNSLAGLGEFGLIEKLTRRLASTGKQVVLSVGDDCAVYKAASGQYQVITTDALVDGVHFTLKSSDPICLGRKTVAVNISDLAAMGAAPSVGVVALGVPASLPTAFLDNVYKGMARECDAYGLSLVGGDTVRSPNLWINLTVVGEARKSRLFTRQGAQPGHLLYVTGTLGDSALGLKLLQSPRRQWKGSKRDHKALIRCHQVPAARLEFSRKLAASRIRVSSMIDISDGLVQDLGHICESGDVGADLRGADLPSSHQFANICNYNELDPIIQALTGGEDYELLFTSPREDAKNLGKTMSKLAVPFTEIGTITDNPGKMRLFLEDGSHRLLNPSMGYNHFKNLK